MHTVRRGDTLWDLAEFYLSDPFLWPEIYRLNTIVVEDPHWIYPAEELALPGEGEIVERPVIPGEERVPGEEYAERVPVPEVPVDVPPQEVPELAPGQPTIFAPRDLAVTTLTYEPTPPLEPMSVTDHDYYAAGMLLDLDELGPRGIIVDAGIPQNVEAPLVDLTNQYERVYVSHPGGEPPEPGDRLLFLLVERRIRPYGHVVRPTGVGVVSAVHEEVSTVIITRVFHKIQVGNTAVALEYFEMERGIFAQPVAAGPTGQLVALFDAQFVPMVGDLGFVNVGRNQGLTVGDEFEVFAPPRTSDMGYRVPEEPIAEGRVVRITEQTATIRFFKQQHAAINVGLPVRLIRKMPS
ncbi:MAG TPA: LysM domain-containing protein [Gemmatimonadota bacterium]|nr:LysM domain-containing protein [Gemmatimonadota bacterium]